MRSITTTLAALGLFATLTASKCGTTGTSMVPTDLLNGDRWNLESIAGKAIQLPEGVENPYIALAKDGSLKGFGGCNQLMGSAKLDGSSLSFPGLGSTKMLCPATQPTESAFMGALRSTNTFKLEGDKLTLLDKAKELATLVKAPR